MMMMEVMEMSCEGKHGGGRGREGARCAINSVLCPAGGKVPLIAFYPRRHLFHSLAT